MNEIDHKTLPRLIDNLRKPDQWEASWPEVRQAFWDAPEQVSPYFCELVEGWLKRVENPPVMDSIIVSLEIQARRQPQLVPIDLLGRVIAHAEQFSWCVPLCTAAMLVRQDPASIITKGLNHVLWATERALQPRETDKADSTAHHMAGVAFDLWRNVALGDPTSMVAILERWATLVGWQRQSTQLIAKQLVDAIPHEPSLLHDSIKVLEKIRDEHNDPEGEFDSPDKYIDKLKALEMKLFEKVLALKIISALDPADFRGQTAKPKPTRPKATPDPRVDRIIEQYLLGPTWEAEMDAASRRMNKALKDGDPSKIRREDLALLGSDSPEMALSKELSRNPSPALIDGVCELVEELIEADPSDKRINPLVLALYVSVMNRPDLIPVEAFQTWVTGKRPFNDYLRASLYAGIATVQPDWIIENTLVDAVVTAVSAKQSDFWAQIGNAYPGLLLQFADNYFKQKLWNRELVSLFGSAFISVAKERLEEIPAMIKILTNHRGDPPDPGVINFRYIEFSDLIKKLEKLGKGN